MSIDQLIGQPPPLPHAGGHLYGEAAMISVAGEIDLDTLPLLRRELWNVRSQDRHHLLVDLTAVTFMDAGALGLLVAVQQRVNASQGSLSLCLNARGVRLLSLTRLTGFFTVQAERECAWATP